MRREPVRPPAGDAEAVLLAVVAVVASAVGWVWLTGQLADWSATGRWPHLGLAALVGVIRRLPRSMTDPGAAWPAVGGWRRAGAGLFYAWGAAGLAVGAAAALAGRGAIGHRPGAGGTGGSGAGPVRRGDGWARPGDVRAVLVGRVGRPGRVGRAGRLAVGRMVPRPIAGRSRLVATETRHSLLVLGPTQSGKTSGLAIPALLEWRGPVVATSVKDDLAAHTMAWRSGAGPCAVFDPTQGSGLGPLSRWSPLAASRSWSDAQRTAGWLVESTPGRRGMADAAFWYSMAAKQLAPLLLAAERSGAGMAEVVRWTDLGQLDEPARLLEMAGEMDAALALTACAGREERVRSSVATTLETVLSPFEDPVVAASTAGCDIDLADLLHRRGTLYLCGPSHEQNRVQGLFAALVSAVVAEAVRAVAATGRPLDPPLLLVLDEAANIAPIRDLDTLASTGAGLGIQLVTVCQDLAQLAARYDPERARTIANNHRAKVLLSGVSDLGTLDLISGLAGEQAIREVSTTEDLRDGRRTRSTSTVLRRLAPTDELRRTPPGEGVLIYGHLPPVRVRLRPWYRDRTLQRRARRRGVPVTAPGSQGSAGRSLRARLGATRGGSPGIFG